jgi:large subunit ribosomal protein L21
MKYAIVESGGKQYKAVEGETIEVDRLPVDAGDKVDLERVLMLVDGDNVTVGTPTVGGSQVKTTVVDHFKGPKIIVFKYSPRKRIRVKSGHRQQYTRLMVDAIGAASKAKKDEAKTEKVEKKEAVAKKTTAKKAASKKTAAKKAAAKKAPAKKTAAKKTAAKKAAAKKTTAKKTATKKSSSKTEK